MLYAQEQAQGKEEGTAQGQGKKEDSVKFILNFTNFGLGANLPNTEIPEVFEGSLELVNFGVEHMGSHIRIAFSPFRAVAAKRYDYLSCSFVNVFVSWNLLDLGKFFFAPAASFHYLFMDSDFHFDRYIIFAGLHSGISAQTEKIIYNFFTVETGFRYFEGKAKFYAGIKFDFIMETLASKGYF